MRNVAATDPVFLRLVDHPRILPLVVDLMGVMWLQRCAVMPPLDRDGESGIVDLLGVMWLKRRVSKPEIETEREAGA